MPAPISYQRQDARRPSVVQYGSLSGSFGGFLSGSYGTYRHEDLADEEVSQCLPRLERNFCKDFSCCGYTLDDLHHLLQHYEEHHVTIEEDQAAITAQLPYDPYNQAGQHQNQRPRPDFEAMKRRALSDMQYHLGQNTPQAIAEDDDIAFDDYSQQYGGDVTGFMSRKRSWRPSMSTPSVATRDFFSPSQSPLSTPVSSIPSTPTMAISHDFNCEAENPLLFGPPSSSTDWLLSDGRPAMPQIKKVRPSPPHSGYSTPHVMSSPQVIEDPGSNLVVVEKPFKCPQLGCDKAYKNQNGLKYHKQHGNCASNPTACSAARENGSCIVQVNKPYPCKVCGKRYKNQNGLKYHESHSHQSVTTDSVLHAVQQSGNNHLHFQHQQQQYPQQLQAHSVATW